MKKIKVMVVDDEVEFLRLIKVNLEETGRYEVAVLSEADALLDQMRLFMPDIILLDILMPNVDGVEACKILNSDPVGKNIPVLILSALDTDKDKLLLFKQGVVDYLIKPVETEEIIARIEKALEYRLNRKDKADV